MQAHQRWFRTDANERSHRQKSASSLPSSWAGVDFVGDLAKDNADARNLTPFLVGGLDAIFRRNAPVSADSRDAMATRSDQRPRKGGGLARLDDAATLLARLAAGSLLRGRGSGFAYERAIFTST